MQKIVPFLWYNNEASEAAEFYTSIFSNSKIINRKTLDNTPSGNVEILYISINNFEIGLMSAGPLFKFTPAISFLVLCQSEEEIAQIWNSLSENGSILMELQEYPFSKNFGWLEDKYGLSWQLMLSDKNSIDQHIMPHLMYVGDQYGKAEQAIGLYSSVFKNSKTKSILKYQDNEGKDTPEAIKKAEIFLENIKFSFSESAYEHQFTFTEAISFEVRCESQDEIDHYWHSLSADPNAEQCGWLKDKFTVSWQIVPTGLNKLLEDKNKEKVKAVTQAFLKMKKIDINELEKVAQRFN